MSVKNVKYKEIRDKMKPGDIVAFSGKGGFSDIIKWSTKSVVSHVGIILQSKLLINEEPQPGKFNQIIESTVLDEFSGVMISRLSERLDTYKGEIWWLPLSNESRKKLNLKKFFDFLLHQNRKKFDAPQSVTAVLDVLDDVPVIGRATHNKEDFSRFFCSELAAAGLEAGGVIKSLNASEVTPIDVCKFNLYEQDYYQIKGSNKSISGFNTLSPEGWGE